MARYPLLQKSIAQSSLAVKMLLSDTIYSGLSKLYVIIITASMVFLR